MPEPTTEGPLTRYLVRESAPGAAEVTHWPLADRDESYVLAITPDQDDALDLIYRIERYWEEGKDEWS